MARTVIHDPEGSEELGRIFTNPTIKRATLMRDATLRDQFAAAALIGMLACAENRVRGDERWLAETAYRHADEMIKARESTGEATSDDWNR
jgi:hypothetical protein